MILASPVSLMSESIGIHDHILLSQIQDSPNLEDQVPVIISLRNWVARLYAQALGSLFVASYDSQGYNGVIRPHLHTGNNQQLNRYSSLYSRSTDCAGNVFSINAYSLCRGKSIIRDLP
jgi:hypothetical protein